MKAIAARAGPAFVIGTGRSGTHWLGHTLGTHEEVRATVEVWPIFQWSKRIALNANREDRLFGRLVLAYRWQVFRSGSRLYLDKSHPNIWIADRLKQVFPNSLFIGIERNPYATVASMLKHKGVLKSQKRWQKFPVPNRFLGITEDLSGIYDSIPVAAQCAMRWVAHHERMMTLKTLLNDDLLIISYEDFAHNTADVISELHGFLGLRQPIPIPAVNKESLRKWRLQLSPEDVEHIREIVGFSPDDID